MKKVTLEEIKIINEKGKKRYNRMSKKEKIRYDCWRSIHSQYGFDIWDEIYTKSDEIGEKFLDDIKNEDKVNEMVSQFISKIKNSDNEDDKFFIKGPYSVDSELCDSLFKDEYMENIKSLLKIK